MMKLLSSWGFVRNRGKTADIVRVSERDRETERARERKSEL